LLLASFIVFTSDENQKIGALFLKFLKRSQKLITNEKYN
jgi:hypothetical protein